MNWTDADAILTTLEQEQVRHLTAYGSRQPSPVVVLPSDRTAVVRLENVIDAMRFYRREAHG